MSFEETTLGPVSQQAKYTEYYVSIQTITFTDILGEQEPYSNWRPSENAATNERSYCDWFEDSNR